MFVSIRSGSGMSIEATAYQVRHETTVVTQKVCRLA